MEQIPGWLRRLPDDARLNSYEIKALFGYKKTSCITQLIKYGSVAEPDSKSPRTGWSSKQYHFQWKAGRIRKILKDK